VTSEFDEAVRVDVLRVVMGVVDERTVRPVRHEFAPNRYVVAGRDRNAWRELDVVDDFKAMAIVG
jgi:hypothetical protein